MKRTATLIALAILSLGVGAQDRGRNSTLSDVLNRSNYEVAPLARAFVRAYGTPSTEQIESHGWVQGTPKDLTAYRRIRLDTSSDSPYSLIADYDNKIIFVVVGSGEETRLYGPIRFPRGV